LISINTYCQEKHYVLDKNGDYIFFNNTVILIDPLDIIPPDTIRTFNCGEIFECGIIFGCETSWIDIELLDYIDDYFKNENELTA
jgi:hypothetical protein